MTPEELLHNNITKASSKLAKCIMDVVSAYNQLEKRNEKFSPSDVFKINASALVWAMSHIVDISMKDENFEEKIQFADIFSEEIKNNIIYREKKRLGEN